MNRSVGLFLAILATSILGGSGLVSANAKITPEQGISISPAYQQVTLHQGQNQQTFNVQITNNQSTAQTVKLTTADLNTFDTGGVLFVGANPSQLQKRYELTPWMTVPSNQVTLPPNQTVNETILINNQADLAPGGHYGAVLVQSTGANLDNSQKNQVGINSVGTSLVFVTKVGGDTYHLSLSKVESPHTIFSLPSTITLEFANVGNTQLVPRGFIAIIDPNHKLVSKGIINTGSSFIFPSTSRFFVVNMHDFGLPKEVGRYTVQVNFRFDGYEQYRSFQSSFYLTTPLGLVFIIVSIVVIVLIVTLAMIKYWKKPRKNSSNKPKKPLKKPSKKVDQKPTSLDIYKRR